MIVEVYLDPRLGYSRPMRREPLCANLAARIVLAEDSDYIFDRMKASKRLIQHEHARQLFVHQRLKGWPLHYTLASTISALSVACLVAAAVGAVLLAYNAQVVQVIARCALLTALDLILQQQGISSVMIHEKLVNMAFAMCLLGLTSTRVCYKGSFHGGLNPVLNIMLNCKATEEICIHG